MAVGGSPVCGACMPALLAGHTPQVDLAPDLCLYCLQLPADAKGISGLRLKQLEDVARRHLQSCSKDFLASCQAAKDLLCRAHLSFEVGQVVAEVASATHALDAVLQLPWRLQDFCDPLSLHRIKGI